MLEDEMDMSHVSVIGRIKIHLQEFSQTVAWCIMEEIHGEKSEDFGFG